MKDYLKDFFLIVANNPLPDNTQKYIDVMREIPSDVTIKPDDYITWLRYGFERRLGREKIKGFDYPIHETKVYELFTDEDFKSFELDRQMLINVLNEIVECKHFSMMKDFQKISGSANSLQSQEVFGLITEFGKCVIENTTYHPKYTDDTSELVGIFALACYGLVSFLIDSKKGGRDRIKKCVQCNNFFLLKRRDERNRFCSDDCRNLHYDNERKTDSGKAERAAYMRGHRKVLKKRAANRSEKEN